MELCAIKYNDLYLNSRGILSDINKVLPFEKIFLGHSNLLQVDIFCLKCYGCKFLAYKDSNIYLEESINNLSDGC